MPSSFFVAVCGKPVGLVKYDHPDVSEFVSALNPVVILYDIPNHPIL